MSRNLKRVPLDFNWPLNKTWGGYLNPFSKQATDCPSCKHGYDREGGRPDANAALFCDQWYGNASFDPIKYGVEPIKPDDPAIWTKAKRNVDESPDFYMPYGRVYRETAIAQEAKRLYDMCYRGHWCHMLSQDDVDALLNRDRLWDFTRVPRDAGQAFVIAVRRAYHGANSWLPVSNGYCPTADEVNKWAMQGMGHDCINESICVQARCLRENVPYTCARCEGTGSIWPSAKIKQQYEDWEPEGPPAGDGYQLWEDVSEGAPVSPVFKTLDALCSWCERNATTFASYRATKKEWKDMLEGSFVHAKEGNNVFM